jgi:phage terminase large subunit-like protein
LLAESERREILNSLTDSEIKRLEYDWDFWARQNQKTPPGNWITWLVLAGRGFGKTRLGAEQILKWKNQGFKRFSLMAKTPGECRDVMILGESGILNCCPPWDMPEYSPSKLTLTWKNGAVAHIFSAENYEQSRGAQCEKAWCDEVAKYKYPQEALDNLLFGMRLGSNPQIIITTTPKPIKTIKDMITDPDTVITRGSTYDNKANLAESFIQTVIKKYENTRLGRQELYAEILDDNPNALWRRDDIEKGRIHEVPKDLVRIVVAIDPAVTSGDESDDTGIVIAGLDKKGHGYVLADMTMKGSPEQWARKAVSGYYTWQADKIVGEANNGGDMIEFLIRNVDRNAHYRKVHATKGKYMRAEPIAALYEQGRVHHVGYFGDLEDQMCEWQPGDKSPNNLDAACWALTDLFIKQSSGPVAVGGV